MFSPHMWLWSSDAYRSPEIFRDSWQEGQRWGWICCFNPVGEAGPWGQTLASVAWSGSYPGGSFLQPSCCCCLTPLAVQDGGDGKQTDCGGYIDTLGVALRRRRRTTWFCLLSRSGSQQVCDGSGRTTECILQTHMHSSVLVFIYLTAVLEVDVTHTSKAGNVLWYNIWDKLLIHFCRVHDAGWSTSEFCAYATVRVTSAPTWPSGSRVSQNSVTLQRDVWSEISVSLLLKVVTGSKNEFIFSHLSPNLMSQI